MLRCDPMFYVFLLDFITLVGKAAEDYRSPRRFATGETAGKSARSWTAPVLSHRSLRKFRLDKRIRFCSTGAGVGRHSHSWALGQALAVGPINRLESGE